MIEEGYLCVQIDYHNTTADICRPFEATIWSITGEAVGQYPPLSHCLNGGPPFHPRCSHYVRPIDVEVSGRKARVTDAEFLERKYEPNDAVKKASTRVHQKIMNAPVFPSVVKYKKISAPMRKRAMNYFPGITEKDIAKVKAKAGAVFQSTKKVDSKRQKLSVEAWKAKRAAEEKPVTITVSEREKKLPTKELRKEVIDYYKENLQGKEIIHPEKGKITLGGAGCKKAKSTSADPVKLYLMKYIDSLIKNSKHKLTEPDTKGRNIKAWHKFTCDAIVDNVEYEVWISTREDDKGIFYYNHVPNLKKSKPQ